MKKFVPVPHVVILSFALSALSMPFLITGIIIEGNKLHRNIQQYQERIEQQKLPIIEI